jgi:bifunctional enzyme CysN/CysC
MARTASPLRIVVVGHVDHGKSTLIGRLLVDTDSLTEGKLAELEAVSAKRGGPLEWSFLLDSFQAERDQAITIDTTQIRFQFDNREFIIIDAPGHREFLKNMISGAAQADAAVLVVDAEEGLQEQTRRHAYLLHLLGLRQVVVVINKMDRVGYDIKRYEELGKEITAYLKAMGVQPAAIVPISAREGDNVANTTPAMGWYQGHPLLSVLAGFESARPPVARPLRFPIQDVYRRGDRRILVGRIETGILRQGDEILFSPTNESARIESIEVWPEPETPKLEAKAGESIGITLDKPSFVERGHMASHTQSPPLLSNVFRAHIFWLSQDPLKVGNTYKVRILTAEYAVSVQSIDRVIDTVDLGNADGASEVPRLAVAEVTLRTKDMIPLDPAADNYRTSRLVIYDGIDIVGGGTIHMEGYADQRRFVTAKERNIYEVSHLLSHDRRSVRNGHSGGIYWFTGLSGAGKSTLAMRVEEALFQKGLQTYVLDGDNVRHGLNADLGFKPEDRAENIRRIGHVAALMADAGTVCITSFISPYRSDRDRARAIKPDQFHEIYIKASLNACEARDPKGLYKKARKGEIADFTGIDSPYEAPENPELVVDTEVNDIQTCINQIVEFVLHSSKVDARENEEVRVRAV